MGRGPSSLQEEVDHVLGTPAAALPDSNGVLANPSSVWHLFHVHPIGDLSSVCTLTVGCVWVPAIAATDAAAAILAQPAQVSASADGASPVGGGAAVQVTHSRPVPPQIPSPVDMAAGLGSAVTTATSAADALQTQALAAGGQVPVAAGLILGVRSGNLGLPTVQPGQPILGHGGLRS